MWPRRIVLATVAAGLGILACGCGSISASGSNAKGVQLYQQSQYNAAIEQFQTAVRRDPNNADACYNLGCVHHRLGSLNNDPAQWSQAEQYYNMAIDRDPNHVEAHRALAVFLVEGGQKDRAFHLLEGWATRQPDLPDARIELARLYEECGDATAANERLLEALSIDPQNPRTLTALGHLREKAGDYSQAYDNYNRSLAYDRFQTDVASRITALQGAAPPPAAFTNPASGTRVVQGGSSNLR